MNALTAVRLEVADALVDAGVEAFEYVPEVVNPPVVVISAGQPYLEDGDTKTFTGIQVRLNLRLVAGQASNEDATTALDQLIVDTCMALSSKWNLETVLEPFGYEVNGALYLAADAVITASIELEMED